MSDDHGGGRRLDDAPGDDHGAGRRQDDGPGDDRLLGGAGDDMFHMGRGGNDTVEGGSGHDRAEYGFAHASASVTANADGTYVVMGPLGHDVLHDVEHVAFLDGTLHFDDDSAVAQVERLYDSAFGRLSDPHGLHGWAARVEAGTSLGTVAEAFARAPEYATRYGAASNADFVEQLYHNTLHRASDAAGKAAWLDAMAHGATRGQVLVGFSESTEHQSGTAGLVRAGLWDADEGAAQVARLYDVTLGRLPDSAGLDGWTAQLKAGATLTSIATGFVGSTEFQGKYGALSNGDFVERLYANTLHRHSDQAGHDAWTGALHSGQRSRVEVVVAFSESQEHQDLTAAQVYGTDHGHFGITFA